MHIDINLDASLVGDGKDGIQMANRITIHASWVDAANLLGFHLYGFHLQLAGSWTYEQATLEQGHDLHILKRDKNSPSISMRGELIPALGLYDTD